MSRAGGFTLIEVLLSVAIIGLLVGLSLPVYLSFQNRNDVDIATQTIAETLRRGCAYSRAVQADSQWGVAILPTAITLFKGSSYASRDTTADETVTLPAVATVSGLTEVVFGKLSGTPTATGTITLTSPATTRSISLNAKGMVDY